MHHVNVEEKRENSFSNHFVWTETKICERSFSNHFVWTETEISERDKVYINNVHTRNKTIKLLISYLVAYMKTG